MTQNNGKGIFDTIGDLLGANKVDQSTGQTTADNTQKAFNDDVVGLGSLVSGVGKDFLGKLDGLKTMGGQDIQNILNQLGQSADPKVQGAKQDLETVKHDGASFVEKLKGYAASLKQIIPLILPTLQNMFAKK